MAFRGVTLSAAKFHLCNKHQTLTINIQRTVSALHVPGGTAKATVSILTPSLTHIDTLIRNKAKVQRNLEARRYKFDLESFIRLWDQMNALRVKRENLETKRVQVSLLIKSLSRQKRGDDDGQMNIKDMKEEGKRLRTQLKELSSAWWDVEERAITEALNLPNVLHARTPLENQLIESHKTMPPEDVPPKCHTSSSDISFTDHSPTAYYLKGPLARLELDWIRSFSQTLTEHSFTPMSATDFVKSIVVDGCGMDFIQPEKVFSLAESQGGSVDKGNGMHLVGGASLPAMAAFLTKNVVDEPFPLRLMSVGRQYQPAGKNSAGLFDVAQASAIQLLSVMENDADGLHAECERVQNIIAGHLARLDVHFRVEALAARHLERWEQYRSSIQMYSPSLGHYVQVAHVSIVGDFISRRLSIYGRDRRFTGFVTSTALCVPKLLACYLENKLD